MKIEPSPFNCLAKCISIVLFLTIIGCTPKITVFPDVRFNSASEFRYFQEQEGLMIAIEPFLEVKKVIKYFGTDLLSEGILPVFVIAENHHLKSAFLLEKSTISLLKKNTRHGVSEVPATIDRQPIIPYSQKSEELRQTSRNLELAMALIPILFIQGIMLESQIADVDSIIENLRKKAFLDKAIYPGQKKSGFVYFQMKDKDDIKEVSSIFIKSKILLLDQELTFNFKLKQGVKDEYSNE